MTESLVAVSPEAPMSVALAILDEQGLGEHSSASTTSKESSSTPVHEVEGPSSIDGAASPRR